MKDYYDLSYELKKLEMLLRSKMQNNKFTDDEMMFLKEMIKHHEMAISMSEKIKKDSELYSFAQNIIKAQSAEIEQMKSWLGKN